MDERRTLGRSGLQVTRYGLGTAPLGGLLAPVEQTEALRTVDAAWEMGLRLFDTAPLYGFGDAERRLGGVLRDRPRDAFVIATKVGRLLEAGAPPDPSQQHEGRSIWAGQSKDHLNPVRDYSANGVQRSLAASMERLGLNSIDIAHVHDPDDHEDQVREETIPALCSLRDAGQLRAVGVGVNQPGLPARLVAATDLDCVLIAGRYTLLDQSALDELLPAAIDRGVGIIAGGVYNSGVLADPDAAEPTYDYAPASPDIIARAREFDSVCRAHDVPLRALALQFPSTHPAVSSVLIGARSVAEMEDNRRLAAIQLPDALWDQLIDQGLLRADCPLPTRPAR